MKSELKLLTEPRRMLGRYWGETILTPPRGKPEGPGTTHRERQPDASMTDETKVQTGNPQEPFACPQCSQMLAPTCRVCVACGQPINFAEVGKSEHALPVQTGPEREAAPGRRAQFSWSIFFGLLAATIVFMSIAFRVIGIETSEWVFTGFTFICAGWVFYDARNKGIPRPWRWSIMTLFFWVVFFSWYVSRRRTPQWPCSVIEAQASIFFRALFWFVLVLVFLTVLTLIAAVVKSPLR